MATQLNPGQSVPPPNPPAGSPGWCHLRMVPPVSSESPDGATRQSGGANWCHPPVRHAGSSPADPAGKPESQNGATRELVSSRDGRKAQNSATRQFRSPPTWCHPPVRRGQLVPPAGSSRRFVTSRFGREARNSALNSATRQFGGTMRILGATPLFVFQDGAIRQFAASVPRWGRPPDRARRIGRSLGPRSDLRGKDRMPEPQHGATRQFVTRQLVTDSPNMVPPVSSDRHQPGATPQLGGQTGATRRFVFGRFGREARVPETECPKQCHPSVRRQHADFRCHPAFRVPRRRHPSVCPVSLPRQFARVSLPNVRCHPPIRVDRSGVVDPGLSAQNCSRSPPLIDSNSSPNATGCARSRP